MPIQSQSFRYRLLTGQMLPQKYASSAAFVAVIFFNVQSISTNLKSSIFVTHAWGPNINFELASMFDPDSQKLPVKLWSFNYSI